MVKPEAWWKPCNPTSITHADITHLQCCLAFFSDPNTAPSMISLEQSHMNMFTRDSYSRKLRMRHIGLVNSLQPCHQSCVRQQPCSDIVAGNFRRTPHFSWIGLLSSPRNLNFAHALWSIHNQPKSNLQTASQRDSPCNPCSIWQGHADLVEWISHRLVTHVKGVPNIYPILRSALCRGVRESSQSQHLCHSQWRNCRRGPQSNTTRCNDWPAPRSSGCLQWHLPRPKG